ncbi:hypothetical protein AB0M20_22435, partial [Actinoplanes sp. NPDC051633]|uniref:hypothetical protein n=1 Tax=Actinoplanes sp. NPDC051633 TaxID=3155670 RepID=UPI003446C69C
MFQALEWILLGAYAAAAIVYGVVRHRPSRIGPWLLLAGAITTLAVGDVLLALDHPVSAEVCYYGMFVLVASAVLQLTRGGAILVDRARLIDLLAFTCATMLVVWVFVIGDSGRMGNVSAADVIGDLLLIGVAARLRIAAGRNVSATLLLVGAVGMLGSDIAWGLHQGWVSELGYVVLYLCWGAAALHPSMKRLTAPMPTRPSPWQGRWAALLGVSVAAPPAVLMIEAVTGEVRDGVVIAVAGALTLLLAITRLADSVAQHSRALTRERALREASEALVAAADIHDVDVAVRAAVTALLPPGAVQKVVFATDDRELTLEALPPTGDRSHGSGRAERPRSRFWRPTPPFLLSSSRSLSTLPTQPAPTDSPSPRSPSAHSASAISEQASSHSSSAPSKQASTHSASTPSEQSPSARTASTPSEQSPSARTASTPSEQSPSARTAPASPAEPSASSRFSRSWWVEDSDNDTASTLVCPLWMEPLAVARPSGGALVLAGRREDLTACQDTLEVLAGHAAMALDRITLVEAVGRRDSDLYLRAVIRNTADIMLVIDEDQRVRYASPGLRNLIGVDELPPLTTLSDLVHPDDRIRVRQTLGNDGDGVLHCALKRDDDTQIL